MDHRSRAVLNQTQVDAKTNEITGLQPLLEDLDLTGQIITAHAMHTQREHADWLVTEQHAAYLLVVKANQPGLYHQLASLPRRAIPLADHTRDRGHGRAEVRRLQITTIAGLDHPRISHKSLSSGGGRDAAGRRCQDGAGGDAGYLGHRAALGQATGMVVAAPLPAWQSTSFRSSGVWPGQVLE
jgi:hypothetical protein